MRLKGFIIFIIIFTIFYILFFFIIDFFVEKKAKEKAIENEKDLLDIEHYKKFAAFYGVVPTISKEVMDSIQKVLVDNISISLSQFAGSYSISVDELIVLILFLEYIGMIKKRIIDKEKDCTSLTTDKDEGIIVNYSLILSSKASYEEIVGKMGFYAPNELEYLNNKMLIPGIKIANSKIDYFGDQYE